MTERVERNKKNAMAFYDLMFNQNRPAEAICVFGIGRLERAAA